MVLPNNLFSKAVLVGKKLLSDNKENLLVAGAIVTEIAAIGFACKGSIKTKDIIEEHKSKQILLEDKSEEELEVIKKDSVVDFIKTSAKVAKEFAPAAALTAASVSCILVHHKVMKNKIDNLQETVAGLTAAYIAIDTAFKRYRKRVVDKYGEKEDTYLRYGIEEKTIEITETNEKGKDKTRKEKIFMANIEKSDYAKYFDPSSTEFLFQDPQKYRADWNANLLFIGMQQEFANNRLIRDGYLFLNDVYEMLGMEKTKAGQVVGWIYDPENPSIDNFVDIKIISPIKDAEILNAYGEECVLLDFNVDGVIIDKLDLFPDN